MQRFTRFPMSGVNCPLHPLLNPRRPRTARFLEEFTIRSPKLSGELLCEHTNIIIIYATHKQHSEAQLSWLGFSRPTHVARRWSSSAFYGPKAPCWDNYSVGGRMYTAGLTAVSGFPPRLPDININTCRRDGLPARRRGAIRNDRGDDDDDDPFSAAYNNFPSPRRRYTGVHFLPIVLRPYGTEYPVKPRRYVVVWWGWRLQLVVQLQWYTCLL